MSFLFYVILSPFLLLVSIPLTIFAAFTTFLSFSTLFFRVLIVYAELAAALVQDHLANPSAPTSPRKTPVSLKSNSEDKIARRKSRRGSTASGSSNGSVTPKAPQSSGLGIYSGEGAARDFEGVGGWRIASQDGEDELWTSMNSRLELPAMVSGGQRHHHRSRTSDSLRNYRYFSKSLATSRALSPQPGSKSPEEYFASRAPSKSTTALDAANIGKALLRPRPSSSSSGSSQNSNRTMQLTLSNA
ncbi:hypothetical protein ACLMJK_001811 [Lecanora helva]